MISGGNATVFISDMGASIRFYTEVLGLRLSSQYGNDWATVEAGPFTIGLHPKSEKHAAPGTRGAIMIGLIIGEPIEQAVSRLKSLGVTTLAEIERGDGGNFAHFSDPDGNELYLWEAPQMA